jgi:hypothetical protein
MVQPVSAAPGPGRVFALPGPVLIFLEPFRPDQAGSNRRCPFGYYFTFTATGPLM